MSSIVNTYQTAITAALAVLLGAVIGFMGNYILASRSLKKDVSIKIAEYRIDWINNLREELSIFAANSLAFLTVEKPSEDMKKYFIEQHKSNIKIRLLMNYKDEDYGKLTLLMDAIIMRSAGPRQDIEDNEFAHENMRILKTTFIEVCNSVLKREWKRTKLHLRSDTIEVAALKSDRF